VSADLGIGLEARKCHHKRQWPVHQRHGVIAGIPRCRPPALGVGDDAAHFGGDAQAAARGRREKLAAEALPLLFRSVARRASRKPGTS